MKFKERSKLANARDLDRTLNRLAHEILEKNKGTDDLAIIGIRTRGEFLAKRLAEKIEKIENIELPVGVLDVVMYRDDFRKKYKLPAVEVTDIPFGIDEKILKVNT